MRNRAIREYEVEQSSTEGMHYRIIVKCKRTGKEVDVFQKPTQKAAIDAFEAAGYKWIRRSA